MRRTLSKSFSVSSFALCLSLLAGCGAGTSNWLVERGLGTNGREVAFGESFKLSRDEKVVVKGTALTVQLKGARKTWYVDGKSSTVDADIIIALDGKEQREWMNIGETVTIDAYTVKLSGADPFGKSSAELVVTRR